MAASRDEALLPDSLAGPVRGEQLTRWRTRPAEASSLSSARILVCARRELRAGRQLGRCAFYTFDPVHS
eukprot:5845549-Prymnesium_polylepis.2